MRMTCGASTRGAVCVIAWPPVSMTGGARVPAWRDKKGGFIPRTGDSNTRPPAPADGTRPLGCAAVCDGTGVRPDMKCVCGTVAEQVQFSELWPTTGNGRTFSAGIPVCSARAGPEHKGRAERGQRGSPRGGRRQGGHGRGDDDRRRRRSTDGRWRAVLGGGEELDVAVDAAALRPRCLQQR